MSFAHKLSKRQALIGCWLLSVIFAAVFLTINWFGFLKEQAHQDEMANQIASSTAEIAMDRIESMLSNMISFSKLIAVQPEINNLLTQGQPNSFIPQNIEHLSILLQELKGSIAFIANDQGKIINTQPAYQTYVKANKAEITHHITTTLKKGQDITFVYDEHRKTANIYTYVLTGTPAQPTGVIAIDFSLATSWKSLGEYSSVVFVTNQYNRALRLGTDEVEPLQLIFYEQFTQPAQASSSVSNSEPDPITDTASNVQQMSGLGHLHKLNNHPAKEYLILKNKFFGVEFYTLPGLIQGRAKLKQLKFDTYQDWQLFVFVDAEPIFKSLAEERNEGVVQIVLIALFFLILDRFVRYHFTIQNLTYVDALTGLNNRTHLTLFLPQTISNHDRGNIKHLGALIIDIDKFKSVNDTYGHAVGDKVLSLLAVTLQENSRDSDLLYRFGGEEFLILCPGSDFEALKIYAERLRKAVEAMEEVTKYVPYGITISIGATERHEHEDHTQWFARADALLYQAKNNGRNRVESEA